MPDPLPDLGRLEQRDLDQVLGVMVVAVSRYAVRAEGRRPRRDKRREPSLTRVGYGVVVRSDTVASNALGTRRRTPRTSR